MSYYLLPIPNYLFLFLYLFCIVAQYKRPIVSFNDGIKKKVPKNATYARTSLAQEGNKKIKSKYAKMWLLVDPGRHKNENEKQQRKYDFQ